MRYYEDKTNHPWWKLLTCNEIIASAERLAAISGLTEDEALMIVCNTL